MPKVSIIVPCYNEEKTISLLLNSIYEQTYAVKDMEVVISDGLSEDATRQRIKEFQQEKPDLQIILIDNIKRNIPAALNAALRASQGEYIVRMDAHSVPAKNYVEKSIQDLEAGVADNVGGVWQIKPGDSTWIAESIAKAASHPLGVGDAGYRYSKESGYVDTVPFGAFKKNLIEEIGFFDEELLSNEDYEFNTRIRQNGGKVWFNADISCVYYARKNLKALAKQYFRYGFWKYKMLRRYPETIRWRQALPPIFVLGMISLLILSMFSGIGGLLFFFTFFVYADILVFGSYKSAASEDKPYYIFGIPLAIMTMHFCWGTGFLWSVIESINKKDEK
ncbi:MAG: glycosyltransferase family 2 protein [Anaerolineaceae bacterium]|nr:glycosyltransferase family 2 protein [Anaerolineaceae bacterium]